MSEPASRAPSWFTGAVDGGPGILFLAVLLLTRNFRVATLFLVIAAPLAVLAMLIVERRVRPMPTVVAVMAVLFGGASLILRDPQVLKMKTSVVDGVLGLTLLGGVIIKRNPLKFILRSNFTLTDQAWATLALRYGIYWLACAAANEVVRRTQSDHTWALFRLASYVVGVLFALAQTPFLLKHNALGGKPESPPEVRG